MWVNFLQKFNDVGKKILHISGEGGYNPLPVVLHPDNVTSTQIILVKTSIKFDIIFSYFDLFLSQALVAPKKCKKT